MNNRKIVKKSREIFERYNETFYRECQEWRDYELTSAGFGELYYDCLPDNKKARILDIGCGDGKFLFFLKQNGYSNIEGVELSLEMVEEARKHIQCKINVVEDSISFLQEHPSTYNLITLNDVLEHVPKNETVNLLKAISGALKQGGNVVINVPQVSGFVSLFCRYNDFTHEVIFTEVSLKQVLSLAGFSDIRFIRQKWPFKWTPRHLVFRLVRGLWHALLKLIYTIESPGEKHPGSFQVRLVASAIRPMFKAKPSASPKKRKN